ncbi:MAG: hypothetical protein ACREMZ_15750 [Gemmatimonadales bacterium]
MKYLYDVTVKYLDGSLHDEIVYIVECGSARRASILAKEVYMREYRRRGGSGRLVDARD